MKLAIGGVSKNWHVIGLGLLYGAITLRRICQLSTFVRALEAREGLGSLVRNLNLTYYIPRECNALHHQETKRIFQLCPRLLHFGFKPPFIIPAPLNILPRISYTITSLEYGSAVEFSLIFPTLVQLSASLRSLSLSIQATYEPVDETLFFEKLEDLRVRFAFDSMAPTPNWTVPVLQRLWLDNGDENNPSIPGNHYAEELLIYAATRSYSSGSPIAILRLAYRRY
jgi:hypothetical protein